ncbi:MAG: hypothetical protein JRE13_15465, partial [Deltaproteobacteria bacterium]|nr:hypothetical protein [Deltaproteobacteria bacterium]
MILLLGLVSAGRADDSRPDESAAPAGQEFEMEPDHHAPDPHVRQPPVSVDGADRVGSPPFYASDVVVVIDHSTLSLVASGIDVDQDGVVGRNRSLATERSGLLTPAQFWTT